MLPDCNPWPDNTVPASSQQSACAEIGAMAAQWELLDSTFLATVLDSLLRLAQAGVTGFQPLTNLTLCDAEANASNAHCALQFVTLPIQFDPTNAKQQILWLLGNAMCENDA
jgi:hypothetical protein